MIEIADISLPLTVRPLAVPAEAAAVKAVVRAMQRAGWNGAAAAIAEVQVLRVAVDARKANDVHFVCSVAVSLSGAEDEAKVADRLAKGGLTAKIHVPDEPLVFSKAVAEQTARPVVVGAGPAGLFAALALAEAGMRPIVVERGGSVDERVEAVERFVASGELDPECNIQFGEGGAGTFSDGKLGTGIKSPYIRPVLQEFINAGASPDIAKLAKPHIGTDVLRRVIPELRRRIEAAGGEVRFHTRLTSLQVADGIVRAAVVRTGSAEEIIPTNNVVLACGHSARDTFQMLYDLGVTLERKPFSIGVRIEHTQTAVNESRYGAAAASVAAACPQLASADYKLVQHLSNGRSVYSFCMCPGGEVVCAASEPDTVVVNGMSPSARDGENANAALLVDCLPEDFGPEAKGPLAGVELQRRVEAAAFAAAKAAGGAPYMAPAQRVGDFLARRAGKPAKGVAPTYARGVAWCDLHECLPGFVSDALEEALPKLGRKLSVFSNPEGVMTGVETRSSSPVRVLRDNITLEASIAGLYPCGEGGGYAGGIMSACVDGLKVAHTLVLKEAAAALRAGKPVAFPTDTVYGLGVAVDFAETPAMLYQIKGRASDKPIAWLVADVADLDSYGADIPQYARDLAKAHWPGALTLVVKAGASVPTAFAGADGSIALRMPDSKTARALIAATGCPLATTSANVSGEAAPATAAALDSRIANACAWVVADQSRATGVASTVVDCTGPEPRILRQGDLCL